MLRFLLTKFWPALIPIALYLLWYGYKKYHAKKTGEVIRITDGPWLITLLSAMALAAAGFIWLGFSGENTGPASYQPAIMQDGKIVDGSIEKQ